MSEHATLKITGCKGCPNLQVGPLYSLDGFDRGADWTCSRAGRTIVSFVEGFAQEVRVAQKTEPSIDAAQKIDRPPEALAMTTRTRPTRSESAQ